MIHLTALDTSTRSTGIARANIEAGTVLGSWTGTRGTHAPERPSLAERWVRLDALATLVEAEAGSPDLLVVEGPAPSLASNAHGHDLAGAWWLILDRVLAARPRLDVLVVAPSKLKKYVTGNGAAKKPQIVEAVRRHYGTAFDLPLGEAVTDVADAIGLLAMGARFLGVPIDEDHPTRLEAMTGVALRRPAQQRKNRRPSGRRPADRKDTP